MRLPGNGRSLCKRCRLPFVTEHEVPTIAGAKAARYSLCPDCDEGADEEREPDVLEYISDRRIDARLRDGFSVLD
jgi:hypothetical protein